MPSRRDCLRAVGAGSLAAVAGCVSAAPVEGRWPRAGYGDRNTGHAVDVDAPGWTLTHSWSTAVPVGRFAGSPVVADGRVFVGYGEPRPDSGVPRVSVHVLDAASGEPLENWTVTTYEGDRTDGALFRDSVVVADGALYLLAYDGVHSFTLDGGRRWHVPIEGVPDSTIHRAGHPVVADGTVYAPTASVTADTDASEGLLAIDDASGEVRWRYEVPAAGTGRGWTYAPALADGTLYVSALDAGVVALDAASGDVRWAARLPVTGSPTVAGGRVFVPTERETGGSFVVALDAASGGQVWRRGSGGERLGRELAATSEYVYLRESLETLVCRYAASGQERWRNTAPEGVALTRPVVTDDALYAGARLDSGGADGIATFHPGVGELLDTVGFDTRAGRETPLAVVDGRLFATTSTGRAYAFEACSLDALGYCIY